MFIGHFGVALASKKLAPRTSLGTLVLAAQWLDFLWPLFLLFGIEHVRIAPGITTATPLDFTHYPYSHSLLMAMVWGALLGGIYFALRRDRSAAGVLALAVVSHWLLDFLVHRPDLPLWPGGEYRVGLGLWNSWAATIFLELLFFGAGLWIYLRTTRPRAKKGVYILWSFVGFLVLGWIGSVFAGAPPSVNSLAWSALLMWLTIPWAWWADRHREAIQ